MKNKITLFLIISVFGINKINAQLLTMAASKLINNGDIIFTTEFNASEKRKEVEETKSFTASQAMYGTVYLNKKISNHSSFYESGGNRNTTITIKSGTDKTCSFEINLKADEVDKKSYCFEVVPSKPLIDNVNHRIIAKYFSELGTGVHNLTFEIGNDGNIKGKTVIDLTAGIGSFEELKKEQERLDKIKAEEDAKKAAEEKKKREEEQAKRDAAIKAFNSSKDIVKVAVKNLGNKTGTIYLETGDGYTSYSFNVSAQDQSDYILCRPGNKIYCGNDLIFTVSSASNNKVISFTPPKTQEEINEEDFEKGMYGISFEVKNSCSNTVYYLVEEGGSTLNTSLGGNTITSHQFKKKGTKIWLSDDMHKKISLIFEVTDYSQKGTIVYLCK